MCLFAGECDGGYLLFFIVVYLLAVWPARFLEHVTERDG